MKTVKKLSTWILVMALSLGILALPNRAEAAGGKKVKLNKTKITLIVGKSTTLKVKNAPEGEKVAWSTNKKTVVSVTKKGKVTAKKAGTAKIIAKVNGKKCICRVTVKSAKELVPLEQLDQYQYFRKYMTDEQLRKTYSAAVKVVKPLKDLSEKEQLRGLAVALRDMFDNEMTYSMTAPHYNDPYGYLVLKVASCAGCARATGFCLNVLGIKYEHVNESQYSHQWARVKVGSEYWICDAYGLYCGPEPAVRKHPYLK